MPAKCQICGYPLEHGNMCPFCRTHFERAKNECPECGCPMINAGACPVCGSIVKPRIKDPVV